MVESKMCGIFFVGLLTLSVSCEKSKDSDSVENLNKIEFQCSNSTESISRGTEMNNATINNFGVYAYYTEGVYDEASSVPNFMFNSHVSRTTRASAWTYAPVMYWPTDGGVSFFAYSPHAVAAKDPHITLGSTLTTEGAPQITYLVPDNVVEQIDLLISTPFYDQTKTSASNADNKLAIPLRHALSSIIFQAKMQTSSTDIIRVKSITLGKLKNQAKVNYTTPISWDMSSSAIETDYAVAIATGLLDRNISGATIHTEISAKNGQLMLIPQTIDHTDQITVVVEMNIDGKISTRTSQAKLSTLIPILEAGKRYTIKINVLALADVDLNISVNTWLTEEIDVPDFN